MPAGDENFARFQCQLSREDIFKPKIGNESLHEISNENEVKAVNFTTYFQKYDVLTL
jgi:hypothetical protein